MEQLDYSADPDARIGHKIEDSSVTGALAEGTQQRTFYVAPNRPSTLTVNPFSEQSGLIKSDEIKISGTANDPDGNDVKVAYRLDGGAPVEIHNGPAGAWTFKLLLFQIKDGKNTVVVEVVDTYNVKVSKTLKFNQSINQSNERLSFFLSNGIKLSRRQKVRRVFVSRSEEIQSRF